LKLLLSSWKHKTRSLYKRQYSRLWVFNNLSWKKNSESL